VTATATVTKRPKKLVWNYDSRFYGFNFLRLNTFIKDLKTLKPGVASSSNNWITGKYGDHIELRRGTQLLGQRRQTGAGKITGLGVGTKKDGSQIPFFTYGKKAKSYDSLTDDMIESPPIFSAPPPTEMTHGLRRTHTSRVISFI
jgi:hypothetical protein